MIFFILLGDMYGKSIKIPLGKAYPIRVAGIDVGSNAIRMMVVEFTDFTTYRVLDTQRVPVRLGHDVFLTGKLTPACMDRALEAFAAFKRILAEFQVDLMRVVATSAVRESQNGQQFVDRVKDALGMEIETILGAEEARLIHLAIRNRMRLSPYRWTTVDVGGGSVEVSLVDDTGILWSESHTMGSVRLLEELSVAGQEPGRFKRLLSEYIATLSLPCPTERYQPEGLIATGGNIEALMKVCGGTLNDEGVGVIKMASLRSAIELLTRMSFRQRMESLGLKEDRADVILPAALVYEQIANQSRAEEILVPFVGVRDGIVLDLVSHHIDPEQSDRIRDEQVLSACLTLGRKCLFDEAHGRKVMELSLALFDQTSGLHSMQEYERRILMAGALLHDIGSFISRKKHHKHSQYIIAASDIPGLSSRDIGLASFVARFHRKSEPSYGHLELLHLSLEDQTRVIQLAAFLRLADALDREHRQIVLNLQVTIEEDALLLDLDARGDLLLEKWAMAKKSQALCRMLNKKILIQGEGASEHSPRSPQPPRIRQACGC